MLPPFIIEQIRRREEEQAQPEQPVLELPLPAGPHREKPKRLDDDSDRGVVIIDLMA